MVGRVSDVRWFMVERSSQDPLGERMEKALFIVLCTAASGPPNI